MQILEAAVIEFAKRYGIEKAIEYFGLDKQSQNPKYAISLGNFSFDPVNSLKRSAIGKGLNSIFGGNLSGIMGPAALMGGALMLGQAFNPLNPNAKNYSPNLAGQIDYLSGMTGMIGKDPGTGLMKYGPGSVLAGKNVASMFGTNNYQKALDKQINYFEKQKEKKGFLTDFQQKRLDDTKKEKKDFFDFRADVRDQAKTRSTKSYSGPTGQDIHGGGGGSSQTSGFSNVDGGPVSNRTGRGRQGYGKGGIASL